MSEQHIINCNYCSNKLKISESELNDKKEHFCSTYCEQNYMMDKEFREKILKLLKNNGMLSYKEIFHKIVINPSMLTAYLNALVKEKKIILTGYYTYRLPNESDEQ